MRSLTVIVMLVLVACKGVEMRAPDGFVVYARPAGSDFRAISAEGIALRVKRTPNEPRSDVGLWSKSLRLNLEQRGYMIRSEETIQTTTGLSGSVLRTASRVENQDFGYICGL